MKAKLIVNNEEIEVEISEEQLKALEPKPKKTGYERAEKKTKYYNDNGSSVCFEYDDHVNIDDRFYNSANYYSDETVAKNNSRADRLMRQLRRFAVEHREKELDWNGISVKKYYINWNYIDGCFDISHTFRDRDFGTIYFDTEKALSLAIDTFKDELMWYFTEYKDSL